MPTVISRRNLFRLRPADWLQLVRESRKPPAEETAPPPVRPPGAIRPETVFLKTCSRCRDCSAACPHGVIDHLGPLAGQAEGTPFLEPATSPCRWCPTMDCIQACQTGALNRSAGWEVGPIARTVLDPARCLNNEGILCDTCALMCPPQVGALQMRLRQPVLDASRCVGCGLCAFHCEAVPGAFHIEPVDLVA